MKGFEDAPEGSWFGSFKVDSDDAWEKVKSGEVKGFSVEGVFEYAKQKNKDQQLLESIYNILSSVK
jgi:phage head maturation protease